MTARGTLPDELASDEGSMNALGLAAFDDLGATAWREVALAVDPEGDVVQIDATVANVGDDLFGSSLIIDYVEEGSLVISALSLLDITNQDLAFYSGGPHLYFEGLTRVHGVVAVSGDDADALTALTLEVVRGGEVVASGGLAPAAADALLGAFGPEGTATITSPQLLFEVEPGETPIEEDGDVLLRVRAETAGGQVAYRDEGTFEVLKRMDRPSRYGNRDGNQGGDDWVKPSVDALLDGLERFDLVYGDLSNMHGGPFPPHATHQEGESVDAWFAGYNNLNGATAATLLSLLDSDAGARIVRIFASYDPSPGNSFHEAIADVTLRDGRAASSVIRPLGGHATHFHMDVLPAGEDAPEQHFALRGARAPRDGGGPVRMASLARGGDDECGPAPEALGVVAYPNPFRAGSGRLSLDVSISEAGGYTLEVFDLLGRLVHRLYNGPLDVGINPLEWETTGDRGPAVASGLYLVRIRGDNGSSATGRVVILR